MVKKSFTISQKEIDKALNKKKGGAVIRDMESRHGSGAGKMRDKRHRRSKNKKFDDG